jgi:hypothetical protein
MAPTNSTNHAKRNANDTRMVTMTLVPQKTMPEQAPRRNGNESSPNTPETYSFDATPTTCTTIEALESPDNSVQVTRENISITSMSTSSMSNHSTDCATDVGENATNGTNNTSNGNNRETLPAPIILENSHSIEEEEKPQNERIQNESNEKKGEQQVPTPPSSNRNFVAVIPSLSMEENEVDKAKISPQVLQSILRPSVKRDSSSTASEKMKRRRKRVTFTMVQIRRYPIILTDNPACPTGPPLGLGWEYEVLPKMNIVDFESFRLRSRRFQTSHLILSHYKRLEIVQRMGYSKEEIAQVEHEMATIQRHRKVTFSFSPCGMMEHALQSLGRKFKRTFLCRKGEEVP